MFAVFSQQSCAFNYKQICEEQEEERVKNCLPQYVEKLFINRERRVLTNRKRENNRRFQTLTHKHSDIKLTGFLQMLEHSMGSS